MLRVRILLFLFGAFPLLVATLLVMMLSRAHAHNTWANDQPVPPWVKAVCCGPDDVHHLRPNQVQIRPDGWHVEGYPDPIPTDQALPAPDGDYWIFYKHFPDGQVSKVYCFFTPFSGT